ncbi:MAG TPA: VOC family protein [Candidatus Thermoplasmatota archaeon]|nr:VOC family protein [Candidatus Thermoplasmatota archaeon]
MPARSAKTTRKTAPARKPSRTASPGRKGTKGAARKPAQRKATSRAAAAKPSVSMRDPQEEQTKVLYRNVTPMLVIDGASAAIAWYTKVFGAKELSRQPLPTGKLMHAAIQVGDSILMLADAFDGPAPKQMVGVTLHIQSPSIDRFWNNAVAGGASVLMPLENMFWGDRYGQLRDPFGHTWSLGWPAKMTQAEKDAAQRKSMEQMAKYPA